MLKLWLSPPGLVNQCSTSGRLTARRAMSGSRGVRDIERQGRAAATRRPTPDPDGPSKLQEPAARQRAHFRAAEALEQRHAPVQIGDPPAASVLIRTSFEGWAGWRVA